jgi:hypothetical protein
VAAANNYVPHNGNHTSHKPALIGSAMPQAATTTVAACDAMLPVWYRLNTMFIEIGTGTPQATTTTVQACDVPVPMW